VACDEKYLALKDELLVSKDELLTSKDDELDFDEKIKFDFFFYID